MYSDITYYQCGDGGFTDSMEYKWFMWSIVSLRAKVHDVLSEYDYPSCKFRIGIEGVNPFSSIWFINFLPPERFDWIFR